MKRNQSVEIFGDQRTQKAISKSLLFWRNEGIYTVDQLDNKLRNARKNLKQLEKGRRIGRQNFQVIRDAETHSDN